MKELTIEEKARAYDKALERAQALYNDKNEIGYANAESVLEEVFPFLKESEDEKIKKEIISFIQDDIDEINLKVSGDYDDRDEDDIAHQIWCKKAISWLENIPYTIDHEKREGFHLGYKAELEKQSETFTKKDVDDAYLKGISDAKNELEKQGEQKPQRMISAEAKEAMYGKPAYAWSEEDEKKIDSIIETIRIRKFEHPQLVPVYDGDIDWLTSLKQRIGG